jgi:hypothetical protein
VDLPGGGEGRSVADIRALDSAAAPSRIANVLYGLRRFLGRVFGWDEVKVRPDEALGETRNAPAMLRRIRRAWLAAYGRPVDATKT